MSLLLSHASRFNPGSELWVISEPKTSTIVNQIDWYFNFQIAKDEDRKREELNPEFQAFNESLELPSYHFLKSSLRLIACSNWLPARWVLLLPYNDDISEWCTEFSKVWSGLQKPTFRVFLPRGVTQNVFELQWVKLSEFQELSIVLEPN